MHTEPPSSHVTPGPRRATRHHRWRAHALARLRPVRLATLAALALLAACSSGDGGTGPVSPPAAPPVPPPPPPSQSASALGFTASPGETELHQPTTVIEVTIVDDQGNRVAGATNRVTLSLGTNPGNATLSGTTALDAVDGVARFDDVALDRRGGGYRLAAAAAGLDAAESDPFDVTFAFTQVTGGGFHSCGLTPSGTAYCWGDNQFGQLGDGGAETDTDVPVAVATDLRFERLSAGGSHTCGRTTAGEVYCWGSNLRGQLGDGRGGTDSPTPRLIAGNLELVQVRAGLVHTCGRTSGGAIYCWGSNLFGQLGDGQAGTNSDLPVAVDTNLTFETVGGAAVHHTCALSGMRAYCWGWNELGQLGDGTRTDRASPVLVQGDHRFLELAAGQSYSCGITLFNETFCWGSNTQGQLGDNNAGTDRLTPVRVAGSIVFRVPSPLSSGFGHTCAMGFAAGASTPYCWGYNASGQLGDGSTGQDRDNPVPVRGGLPFSELDTGGLHTCGVTEAGEAFCWGRNDAGALGDGNAGTDSDTPVRVLDPT